MSVFDWLASKIDPTHGRPLSEQVELRCEKTHANAEVGAKLSPESVTVAPPDVES